MASIFNSLDDISKSNDASAIDLFFQKISINSSIYNEQTLSFWKHVAELNNISDNFARYIFDQLNNNNNLYKGYIIVCLFINRSILLDNYYEISKQDHNKYSIARLLYDTGEFLCQNKIYFDCVNMMLYVHSIGYKYSIIGDFDPYDSSGLYIEKLGSEEQNLMLKSILKK